MPTEGNTLRSDTSKIAAPVHIDDSDVKRIEDLRFNLLIRAPAITLSAFSVFFFLTRNFGMTEPPMTANPIDRMNSFLKRKAKTWLKFAFLIGLGFAIAAPAKLELDRERQRQAGKYTSLIDNHIARRVNIIKFAAQSE